MQYRFDDYLLDLDRCELVGPAGVVHIEPQVYDVLTYLVRHRDRVVTKAELFDEVWGTRFVTESAVTSRIKSIRSALGDSGRAQHTIRTVHGKGYRFVAAVTEIDPGGIAPDAADAPSPDERPVAHSDADGGDTATIDMPPVETIRRIPSAADQLRGRQAEIAELTTLLDTEPLVTVLGPGGTGKTRLSIEVANRLPPDQPAIFVDLAAVRDGESIGQSLAAALRVEIGINHDIVEACTGFLRSSRMLLIIDNCEHIASAAAKLVDRILNEAPSTMVLATSRVPLGVRGETIFRLSPLPVPHQSDEQTAATALENPSVALFVDRVRKVQHDYQLDDRAVADVISLCEALDGLPLALELAAGRMSTFSLEDLLQRLDHRLDLLGDDRTGTDDRHRSLRATLDWSYDLLDQECQRLFLQLAVFPAGQQLEGIEWLGAELGLAEPLLTLNRLVEASLVGRTETPSGVRYTQLETMRTLGIDLLTEQEECDSALDLAAGWALELTGEMDRTLMSDRELHWDDRIRREIPNIREARNHLRAKDRTSDLIRISVNLNEWARLRDVSEIWKWCDELTTLADLDSSEAATVHALAAQAAWRRGRIQEAEDFATLALDTDPEDWTKARALSALGVSYLFSGELMKAAEAWELRADIDHYFIDRANSALCHAYSGDVATAEATLADLKQQATELGWPQAVAWCHYILGEIEALSGRPSAIDWLEKAVAESIEIGAAFTIGVAGLTLCTLTAAEGDVVDAAGRYRDLIAHWLRSGGWTQQWTTLRHAAALLGDSDPALALTIFAAADTDPYAPGLDPTARQELESLRSEIAARLDPDQLAAVERTVYDRGELAEQTRAALADLMDSFSTA